MIWTPSSSSPDEFQLIERLAAANQRHATTRHDAFFKRGLRGGLGIFQQRLPLLHFRFCRRSAVDLRDATGELRQAFLQFFAIVFTVGRADFGSDLIGAADDLILLAATADDRGVFRADLDLSGFAQVAQLDAFQFDAQILEDRAWHRSARRYRRASLCDGRRSPEP